MCLYVDYMSSRCNHPVISYHFRALLCDKARGTPFDHTKPSYFCPEPRKSTYNIDNPCYFCFKAGHYGADSWLHPLDPRIEYISKEGPEFDTLFWYIEEWPLNPNTGFREINWNPDANAARDSDGHDEEPLSPTFTLAAIPTEMTSFRNSPVSTGSNFLGNSKISTTSQPEQAASITVAPLHHAPPPHNPPARRSRPRVPSTITQPPHLLQQNFLREKVMTETRVQLEEAGKESSAEFKSGSSLGVRDRRVG